MPTDSFTYAPLSIEVFFGNGRFGEVAEITSRFGLNRVLALSTKSDRAQALAQHAGAQLGARLAG
ncbi:MAG: hypothetical protein K0U93_00950 [Gammaproteobacteria bacterium]|nr:hypothetical protein [Gammaproteobacteria bacterium]